MLEFYFRFRFLRLRHDRHVILHLRAKFHPNRTIRDRVMTSYPFSRCRPRRRNSTSGYWKCNLPAYQMSVRYLDPRLRYYYICFLKTNVRHVKILLLVPICTFASQSLCHSASAYQISSKSDHPRQSYDVISIFQDGGNGIAILLPFWLV